MSRPSPPTRSPETGKEEAIQILRQRGICYRQLRQMAEELDYIPIPDGVVDLAHGEWAKIQDPAGKPVFPM